MVTDIQRRARAALFVDRIVTRAAREYNLPFTYIAQSRGQQILTEDFTGSPPYQTMISTNGQMVNFLTKEGYDINWRHKDEYTMYGEQELVQARDTESYLQEDAESVLSEVGQNLLMRSLRENLTDFEQKFLRLAADPDARDISVLSYLGEMHRKINRELKVEEAMPKPAFNVKDTVEFTVELTQAMFSERWGRYFYEGLADETQPVRWSSAKRMANVDEMIQIKGRVRDIQDSKLMLHFVKKLRKVA